MRFVIVILIVAGLFYGCNRSIQPDYTSKVFSYQIYDNFVTRAEADHPNCIWLNTNFMNQDGYTVSNGTFDLIDGRPVCGLRADIVTTDGKKYVAFFNRFHADPSGRYWRQDQYNDAISNGVVECRGPSALRDKRTCSAGKAGIFGPSKEVHGPF